MLSTARISLPVNIAARLETEARYSDNVNDYARDGLIGFDRPLAAAFALISPVLFAMVYQAAGLFALLEVGLLVVIFVALGLCFVGRIEWPSIVETFQFHTKAKRKAEADLRCDFGESSFLSNGRAPRFFEHKNGVVVLADAGDLKTLYFNISNDGADARWELYNFGELHRRVWRWLRLPVSREVVKFSTEGSKLAVANKAPFIASKERFETINIALGEPLDGSVIHRPFSEIVEEVERIAI